VYAELRTNLAVLRSYLTLLPLIRLSRAVRTFCFAACQTSALCWLC